MADTSSGHHRGRDEDALTVAENMGSSCQKAFVGGAMVATDCRQRTNDGKTVHTYCSC